MIHFKLQENGLFKFYILNKLSHITNSGYYYTFKIIKHRYPCNYFWFGLYQVAQY